MFLAFSPEQLCSDLSRQIKSLLSLNWQVLKVLIVKFQASTLDQCHHLLINLSCKSASKSLNATSARSAVWQHAFCSQYCIRAWRHRGRHYDCASYTVFTRFRCTPAQYVQSKLSSDFALTDALTSDFRSRPSTTLSCIWEVDPAVIKFLSD